MERGYVKLWRKCLDSGLIQNGPAWQLFGYLLLKTTHRPHRQIVGGMVFELEPGEVVFGRAKAAADLGIGEQSIRTALKLLEKLEIVTSRATSRCTVISFVNWHKYQDEQPAANQQDNQPPTNSQPTANQHLTTNKNVRTREYKNTTPLTPLGGDASGVAGEDAAGEAREVPPTRRPRQRFVPPSASDVEAYCLERGNGIDPVAFVDFYAAKGWCIGKTPMKDWKAAVRTWENERREKKAVQRVEYQMPIN